eukprot:3619612-Amphidinium_carterae.3
MSWNAKQVASLMHFVAAMSSSGGGKPGNWGSRRCSRLAFDTSGQTPEGFCRNQLELYSLRLLQLRLSENLFPMQAGPWQCEAEQRPVGRVPPTKTSPNIQSKQGELLTEQLLREQIKAAKDDLVMTEILELVLTKLTADKQQALPLKDQRAKFMAEAEQLADKVDKQTRVIQEAARGTGNANVETGSLAGFPWDPIELILEENQNADADVPMEDGSGEQADEDRHAGEAAAGDRVGNEEQRKRIYARLEASEDPLGVTGDPPPSPVRPRLKVKEKDDNSEVIRLTIKVSADMVRERERLFVLLDLPSPDDIVPLEHNIPHPERPRGRLLAALKPWVTGYGLGH